MHCSAGRIWHERYSSENPHCGMTGRIFGTNRHSGLTLKYTHTEKEANLFRWGEKIQTQTQFSPQWFEQILLAGQMRFSSRSYLHPRRKQRDKRRPCRVAPLGWPRYLPFITLYKAGRTGAKHSSSSASASSSRFCDTDSNFTKI